MSHNDFFDSFSSGDADEEDADMTFAHYMNIRAFLQHRFGGTLGSTIYRELKKAAQKMLVQNDDEPDAAAAAVPAIIFRGKGGHFASITLSPAAEEDEEDF